MKHLTDRHLSISEEIHEVSKATVSPTQVLNINVNQADITVSLYTVLTVTLAIC